MSKEKKVIRLTEGKLIELIEQVVKDAVKVELQESKSKEDIIVEKVISKLKKK